MAKIRLSGRNTEILHGIKAYLESNFDKELKNKEIAKSFGTNDYIIKEGFKQLFGLTLRKYLIQLKIERGLSLYQSGKYSLEEISERVGYRHLASFTRVCKKKKGNTPSRIIQREEISTAYSVLGAAKIQAENVRLRQIIKNQKSIMLKVLRETNYVEREKLNYFNKALAYS